MIIDVVTLFPSMFSGVVGESILKRAQEQGQVKINLVNLRDFSKDKHPAVGYLVSAVVGMLVIALVVAVVFKLVGRALRRRESEPAATVVDVRAREALSERFGQTRVHLDGGEAGHASAQQVCGQSRTGSDLEHVVTQIAGGLDPGQEVGLEHASPLRARQELQMPLVQLRTIDPIIAYSTQ